MPQPDCCGRWCRSAWLAVSDSLWAAALGTIIGWACWGASLHLLAKHGGDGREAWLAGGMVLMLLQLLVTAGHLASSRWWQHLVRDALQQHPATAGCASLQLCVRVFTPGPAWGADHLRVLQQSNGSTGSAPAHQPASFWKLAVKHAKVVVVTLPLSLLVPFFDLASLLLWARALNQKLEAEHMYEDEPRAAGEDFELAPGESNVLRLCHEYLKTRVGFVTAFQAAPQLLWFHGYLLLQCRVMHSGCRAQQPDFQWLLVCASLDVATLVIGLPHLLGLLDWITLAGLWRPRWALLREVFDVCLYMADIGSDVYFVVQRFTTPGNPAWVCAVALTALLLQYPVSVVILLLWNWVPHQGRHGEPVGRRPSASEAASLMWAGLVLTCCFWLVDLVAALVSVHECSTAGWGRLTKYQPFSWINDCWVRFKRCGGSCCSCFWRASRSRSQHNQPTTADIGSLPDHTGSDRGASIGALTPREREAGVLAAWIMAAVRRCCLQRCSTRDVQQLLLVLLPKKPSPEWAENHLFVRMPLEAALEAVPQLTLQILVFLFVDTGHRPPSALFFLMLSASCSLCSIIKAALYVWDAGTAMGASLLCTLKLLLQLQGSFRVPASILAKQVGRVEVVHGSVSVAIPAADLSPLQQAACVLGQVEDAVGRLQPSDHIHVVQLSYHRLYKAGVRGQADAVQMSLPGMTAILQQRLPDLALLLDTEQQVACIVQPFLFQAPGRPGALTPQALQVPGTASKGPQGMPLGCLMRVLTNHSCESADLQSEMWDGPLLQSLQGLRFQSCDMAMFALEQTATLMVLEVADCTALRSFKAVNLPQLQQVRVAALASLRVLHLSNNPQLQTLQAEPDSLGSLQELVVRGCGRLRELPFEQLPALHRLDLSRCTSLAGQLPETLGALTSLTQLLLSDCNMVELPLALGQLTALQELCLSRCSKLVCLPRLLGHLGALRKLDLSGCSQLKLLPESVGNLFALTQLRLNACSSLEHLPHTLGQLTQLEELHASSCSVLQHLPASVGQLRSLQVLDLSNCRRLNVLRQALLQLSSLKTLDLSGCRVLQLLDWLLKLEGQGTAVILNELGC